MIRSLTAGRSLLRIAACAAVACLWACTVGLGIEKKDGEEDPPADPVDDGDVDPVDDGDVDPDGSSEVVEEADVAPEPTCDGLSMWDVCWYLGEANATCSETCEAHGGFSDLAPRHVGSAAQGGSREECETLMTALGQEGTVTVGSAVTDKGLGCHRWADGALYWVQDVDLDPGARHAPAQLACGCNE